MVFLLERWLVPTTANQVDRTLTSNIFVGSVGMRTITPIQGESTLTLPADISKPTVNGFLGTVYLSLKT